MKNSNRATNSRSSSKSTRANPRAGKDEQSPSRHNLTIADVKAHISAIFEPLVGKSYDAILNKWNPKTGKGGFNQKHIRAANKLEDQRSRIIEGFKRLDEAETKEDFNAIADRIMEIAENELTDALLDFLTAFTEAVYEAVEKDLD